MELSLPTLDAGEGVVLRPGREADAAAYAAAFRDDPDLGRIVGVPSDPGEDEAGRRIAAAEEAALAGHYVELAVETPQIPFAGMVIASQLNEHHRRCDVGYWLALSARRRGVGRRAVGRLVDWLFDDVAMERIELEAFPDNAAAKALARSLGFVEEGVMRKRNLERGVRVDLALFALLREER